MTKRQKMFDEQNEDIDYVPLPLQIFLWRQANPFVKHLGKARGTAVLEQQEACKSYEKVIVQNILFGQSPSLTDAIKSIDRWRLIKISFPFVLQCCSALLCNRMNVNFDKLGSCETKLLYTLHWILMDAAEECADSEGDSANASAVAAGVGVQSIAAAVAAVTAASNANKRRLNQQLDATKTSKATLNTTTTNNKPKQADSYLLPISSLASFIHYFAPIINDLKHSNFLSSFRLENGAKIWEPLFEHQHPDIPCFTAQVRPKGELPKMRLIHDQLLTQQQLQNKQQMGHNHVFGDVFLGVSSSSKEKCDFQQRDLNNLNNNELSSSLTRKVSGRDKTLATYLDIAVLKCLFNSMWQEQGVDWALKFIVNRLLDLQENFNQPMISRPRSKSLPNLSYTEQQQQQIDEIDVAQDDTQSGQIEIQSTQFKSSQIGDDSNRTTTNYNDEPSTSNDFLSKSQIYLNVVNQDLPSNNELAASGGQDLLQTPKNSRRLSFSSGINTLANQIKKTSKRMKKSNEISIHQQQQNQNNNSCDTKQQLDGSAAANRHRFLLGSFTSDDFNNKRIKKRDVLKESLMNDRHFMRRRSSSTDDISLSQVIISNEELESSHKHHQSIAIKSPKDEQVVLKSSDAHNRPSHPKITVTKQQKSQDMNLVSSPDPMNDGLHDDFLHDLPFVGEIDENSDLPCELKVSHMTRSQTVPRNISYFNMPIAESPGASNYVNQMGQLDLNVILKALHSISMRESVCSIQVCDDILNILVKLNNLDILKYFDNTSNQQQQQQQQQNRAKDDKEANSRNIILRCKNSVCEQQQQANASATDKLNHQSRTSSLCNHNLFTDILLRLSRHMGCANACSSETLASMTDNNRDHQIVQNLRARLHSLLKHVSRHYKIEFLEYMQDFVCNRPLQEVIDTYHSIFSFCREQQQQQQQQNNVPSQSMNLPVPTTVHFLPTSASNIGLINHQLACQQHQSQLNSTVSSTSIAASATSGSSNNAHGIVNASKVHPSSAHHQTRDSGSIESPRSDASSVLGAPTSNNQTSEKVGQQQSGGANKQFGGYIGYANNFGSGFDVHQQGKSQQQQHQKSLESIIISHTFRPLIDRISKITKELKLQENTSLYCDIRRFIAFVQYNYGGSFRSVVLSPLIDSAKLINSGHVRAQRHHLKYMISKNNQAKAQQHQAHMHSKSNNHHEPHEANMSESPVTGVGAPGNNVAPGGDAYTVEDASVDHQPMAGIEQQQNTQMTEVNSQVNNKYVPSQEGGPMFRIQSKAARLAGLDGSSAQELFMGSDAHNQSGTLSDGGQNSFGSNRFGSPKTSPSQGILSFSKAKKKFEDQFKLVFSKTSKLKPSNIDDELGDHSRRTSFADNYNNNQQSGEDNYTLQGELIGPETALNIREQQLLLASTREGMTRFTFLMESCAPGNFLDAPLMAALLELKSPVAVRAALFFECANFVHRCNRGQWPAWMKLNVSIHRPSNSGTSASAGTGTRPGKSSSIQRSARTNTLMYRAAGKAFYSWAEAIGARLEDIINTERQQAADRILEKANQQQQRQHQQSSVSAGDDASLQERFEREGYHGDYNKTTTTTSEMNQEQEQMNIDDEMMDKFSIQDKTSLGGNSYYQTTNIESELNLDPLDCDLFQDNICGSASPFCLKVAACQLLLEITSFLRETYRYLPPKVARHVSTRAGDKMAAIYDVSRAVTANRRWSMALSSLGFGQLPASLSAISANTGGHSGGGGGVQSSNMNDHPERRISFILHETNDENEQQSGPPTTLATVATAATIAAAACNSQHGSSMQTSTLSATGAVIDASVAAAQAAASAVASPLATVSESDAIKKLATKRLSQSSASSSGVAATTTSLLRSSGVIDNITHRRKSIKLRRANDRDRKTKFRPSIVQQDFDEEPEGINGPDSFNMIRRADSLRSRRKVSGISERSDTSERVGELSGDESTGNLSGEEQTQENIDQAEADESKIMSHMPWFKAIGMVNGTIDCACNHYPSCNVNCYKVQQTMCKRLVSAIQSVYEDPDDDQSAAYAANLFDSQFGNLINIGANTSAGNAFNAMQNFPSDNCAQNLMDNRSDVDVNGNKLLDSNGGKRKDRKIKKIVGSNNMINSNSSQSNHLLAQSQSPNKRRVSTISHDQHHNIINYGQQTYLAAQGIATSSQTANYNYDYGETAVNSCTGPQSGFIADAVKAFTIAKAKKHATAKKAQEEAQMIKYIHNHVKTLLHCPMSSFLKGAIILQRPHFVDMIQFSWNLLLEDDQQLSRTAAVAFIISSVKCPAEASKILLEELESDDASRKLAAINKFYVIWDARYQCWQRMEEGAYIHFKMAPPSIEFTLPSPKIAQESKPVVDPPWLPRKTSKVEEVTIGQDQTLQRSFVTATKTRRKQQIELVSRALKEKHNKLREEREEYHITSVPVNYHAAFEPTLSHSTNEEIEGGGVDDDPQSENRTLHHMKMAHALFPSCLCQGAVVMINLLEDSRVTYEGSAVYEVASKVIWYCLVEDSSLFLRHFFERLTRQNQNTIFQVLRRLIRFMPRLPPQAAYTLYNYLIGFIIFYIRCPMENSQKLISDTLSVLCLVVPSVYGLFLKDLKQILRKEQCDHNLLITANVPSAKKIIVHGSDSSGIPSQFPIDEATQFYHILTDSLEFFGIEKPKQNEYFLVDARTNQMHNLHSFVRDYYSFKRSQHPQLQLVNMEPNKAFEIMQKQALTNQFLEFGKVLMSLSIVKSPYLAVQRVLFLHEELMKLPTFPRKALDTNFHLFRGTLGHQVLSMDRLHKICWVRLVARMFELTSDYFRQLSDLVLFFNVVNGVFVLHCEEASVTRLCLATFINAACQFKDIFAADGFKPIMPTIVRIYSNHQNNELLCRSIEFVCKQFYIMHRKPFLLQLFGSVAPLLSTESIKGNANQSHDPHRVSAAAFFKLLKSLEEGFKDRLDILELVDAEKPLKAIDEFYHQDKEAIEILDIISLCVTVTAYASESPRSTQMLIILEAIIPLYMKHLQASSSKKSGKQGHKDELHKIQSISICIRTLIVGCEGLTRTFSGPQKAIDLRGSSIRRGQQSKNASSPLMDANDDAQTGPTKSNRNARRLSSDENDLTRAAFIIPRDTLLNLVADFLTMSTARLIESAKKYVDLHQKHSSYELLDVKSHLRLAEIANSLLKLASNDPSVMACKGLTRYINEVLPNSEWRQEAIRPALIMILKRLDKTFNRIAKKNWVKRSTDWEAAKQLLKGAYMTFIKHPYIVHLPHLKSLIGCCQNIILNDGIPQAQSSTGLLHLPGVGSGISNQLSVGPHIIGPSMNAPGSSGGALLTAPTPILSVTNTSNSNSVITSPGFGLVTVRLIAMQLLQTGDSQTLESFIGANMNTPDKLESLMLNMIYPMCIRVCSGAKEAPKLRQCDIMYILNVVLNLLAPNSASSKTSSAAATSPKSTTDTSQFILSKITTTIGNTNTGATLGIVGAGNLSSNVQVYHHHEGLKIGFLGLKILCVCFESQLATEWVRISRCIRDLAMQKGQPCGPLWDFLDFVVTYRFPLFVLLLPLIRCQLSQKVKNETTNGNTTHQLNSQLIDAKIQGCTPTVCRSKSFLFVSLTAELRMLKEHLINRRRIMTEGDGRFALNIGAPELSSQQTSADHFHAYHRLSAAIASLANQSQGKQSSGSGVNLESGPSSSSGLKTPGLPNKLCPHDMNFPSVGGDNASLTGSLTGGLLRVDSVCRSQQPRSSVKLSSAQSREEARRVINTLLRRTSYPHNHVGSIDTSQESSSPKSPTANSCMAPPSKQKHESSLENSSLNFNSSQRSAPVIIDPTKLIASFPIHQKHSPEPKLLERLIQTIDKTNSEQQQQHSVNQMRKSASTVAGELPIADKQSHLHSDFIPASKSGQDFGVTIESDSCHSINKMKSSISSHSSSTIGSVTRGRRISASISPANLAHCANDGKHANIYKVGQGVEFEVSMQNVSGTLQDQSSHIIRHHHGVVTTRAAKLHEQQTNKSVEKDI